MRFYVVHARRLLLWMIGGMMLFFFAGVFMGKTDIDASIARAVSIHLEEEPADQDDFVLEVVSASVPAAKKWRVYIYHTHTYEAYEMEESSQYIQTEKWRTADPEYNMVRVGAELAEQLQAAGIQAVHDTAAYEMPRLSTAYSRSLEGLEKAVQEGYDLYIDLHRDSYSENNGPNTVCVDQKEMIRFLFLIGQGTGTGFDERPDWEKNRKAAQMISDALNAQAAGISRGVSLKSGRYNQQAATPCILIEAGNNKNTLSQALAAMPLLAQAICQYFDALE